MVDCRISVYTHINKILKFTHISIRRTQNIAIRPDNSTREFVEEKRLSRIRPVLLFTMCFVVKSNTDDLVWAGDRC